MNQFPDVSWDIYLCVSAMQLMRYIWKSFKVRGQYHLQYMISIAFDQIMIASSEKTFQELSENSEGEQQHSAISLIDYGDISKLRNALYSSFKSYLHAPKHQQTTFQYLTKKIVYFLELVWQEVMPKWIIPQQILGKDLPHSIIQSHPNILVGSWSNALTYCHNRQSLFGIMVYSQNSFKKEHKSIFRELANFTIIPIHASQITQIRELGIEKKESSVDPTLFFCQFNLCEELVIFAELQLTMNIESFREIMNGIMEEVEEYQKVEEEMERVVASQEEKQSKLQSVNN